MTNELVIKIGYIGLVIALIMLIAIDVADIIRYWRKKMIRVLEPNKDYIIRADRNGIVDDVIEYKHGHWDNKIIDARFDVPHTVARCSNCKGKIWVYAENYVVKYPYCPLCGAKMDEVEE